MRTFTILNILCIFCFPTKVFMEDEFSAKTTYQTSAKGSLNILDASADGKYITLENQSRSHTENINDWTVTRMIDGKEGNTYKCGNIALLPGQRSRIYAKGQASGAMLSPDCEAPFSSWGIGANIVTTLRNPFEEERATHIQKTIYSN